MSLDSQDDSALSLKKRARRRLVGAIALVILMLVILPNILKDKSKHSENSVVVNMEETGVIQMQSDVPVVENAAGEMLPQISEAEIPSNEVAVAEPIAADAAELVKEIALDAQIDQKPLEVAEVVKVKAAEAVAVKEIPVKVVAKQTADKPKTVRYLIQVGVFAEPGNVKRMQAKIKQAGFTSKITKMQTPKGEMIRLRVGSFVTRDAAATALKKLKGNGLPGMVMANK